MKLNKRSILIALAILILFIGIAKAETPVSIGGTLQPDPFEANPTAHTLFGNYISSPTANAIVPGTGATFTVANPARAYDTDLTNFAGPLTLGATVNWNGKFDVKNFQIDATDPAITQVDLRLRYQYTASVPAANFQYNITADLGTDTVAGRVVLVANTGTTAALATYKFNNLARPGGGSWSFADMSALRIRFGDKRLVAAGTAPIYRVYEVWIRVQCDGVPREPSVTFPLTNAYDGKVDMQGYYGGFREAAGYVKFDTFTTPGFDPTWVDFKAKYAITAAPDTATTGDEYRLTYWVGGAGETVLQDWTNATNSVATAGSATIMGQTWFNQPDTYSGGAWTAADVGTVEVRLEVRINGDEDMIRFDIYEVWLTCYSSPLPSIGSPSMSVIPQVIAPGAASDRFFVDIYVRDMPQGTFTGLAGWQFTLNYDSAILTAVTPGCVYWPWTDEAAYDFTVPGAVSISYTIPTSNPLYLTGPPGSDFPIARIYFEIADSSTTNYSPLWFTVSFLGDPQAGTVPHAVYNGFYGNILPTTYLVGLHIPKGDLFPYGAPLTTNWMEQYPILGNMWHLTSWTDNEDTILSVSDQIDMTPTTPSGDLKWFHVDQIWECDAKTDTYVFMLLTDKTAVPEFPLGLGIVMMIAPAIAVTYLWRTHKKVTKP